MLLSAVVEVFLVEQPPEEGSDGADEAEGVGEFTSAVALAAAVHPAVQGAASTSS